MVRGMMVVGMKERYRQSYSQAIQSFISLHAAGRNEGERTGDTIRGDEM